jgi:hypothetical protein
MKELTQIEITQKWGTMLSSLGIPPKYIDKISQYAHHHAMIETLELPAEGGSVSTLPVAISVLKHIKDLSKIRFIKKDDYDFSKIQMHSVSFPITQDDIFRMKYDDSMQVVSSIEDAVVQKAASDFNAMIDADWYITFGRVVSSMSVVAEETLTPQVFLKSECFFEREPSQSLI